MRCVGIESECKFDNPMITWRSTATRQSRRVSAALSRRKMSHDIYMFLVLALLFAAIVVLMNGLSRMSFRSYYLDMANLSKYFSGSSPTSFFSNPKFDGSFSGYKFTIAYAKSGGRGLSTINGLYLVCDIRSSSRLKIFAYDTNPGPMLFAKRINLGDNNLDKYYMIKFRTSFT